MAKTWTIVANSSRARILEGSPLSPKLTPVLEIDNPEGRLHERDFLADRPGRSFDSRGPGRHSMAKEVDVRHQVVNHFSKKISTILNQGRLDQNFDRLILVAEPQLLGEIRNCLDAPTAALVVDAVAQNLVTLSSDALIEELKNRVHV